MTSPASRLDYLQDLGITAIWLLPFYPSPLRDDGYDIADYTNVHPDSGTLRDFRGFLREAHRRGLRVITELVLNHTSDQHPWFQRARRARPGTPARYWHRVYSHQPDLNYRNPAVVRAIAQVLDFWLRLILLRGGYTAERHQRDDKAHEDAAARDHRAT